MDYGSRQKAFCEECLSGWSRENEGAPRRGQEFSGLRVMESRGTVGRGDFDSSADASCSQIGAHSLDRQLRDYLK